MTAYPQKPPLSQDELVAFLNEAPIARLSSLNPDGTIHIAPVYFKYDNGDILIGTQDISHKVRNIKNNQNVTVLIDNQAAPFRGVLIYGVATLEYENVIAKRASIFSRYMSAEDAQNSASNLANQFQSVVVRIKPQKVTSYDYTKPGLVTTSEAST
jgi:nitroimidazol reductase NimA-like FMN-containing flavoprotein (pyridoxamine 5'-phosphate oxidase superfamily)